MDACRRNSWLLCVALAALWTTTALAHWDVGDGHKMHYPQLPDPHGWDVCLRNLALADDFMCSESGAITDIHVWVSWRNDVVDEALRPEMAIYSDENGHPGRELWRFTDGEIAIRYMAPSLQGWICPCTGADCMMQEEPDNHTRYAQVNITEIVEPFIQEEGQIYWLVIRMGTPLAEAGIVQTEVGWKTTLPQLQWNNPAMWIRWPLSSSIGWRPIVSSSGVRHDLSFVINGKPLPEMDFGDAPETNCTDTYASCLRYPTTLARNGARHYLDSDVYLGNPDLTVIQIDTEPDGQPSIGAYGDDTHGIDDEEGVIMPSDLVAGQTYTITVLASIDGYLDAWIDYNGDGDWDDLHERIAASQALGQGENELTISVPATQVNAAPYDTYARFRFSTHGRLNYYGPARNGEVEDYMVKIHTEPQPRLDFGDVPELRCEDDPSRCNTYPTTLGRNGARHQIVPRIWLGRLIDPEPDGQPTILADGDDTNALDDEDGVFFVDPVVPGKSVRVKVLATVDGFLNAWIDFADDGNWSEAGDWIFQNEPLAGGVNELKFMVPPATTAAINTLTYSRFRFTSYPVNDTVVPPYAGLARDGEVEDYPVKIQHPTPEYDFGDAPDPCVPHSSVARPFNYPTKLFENGARHLIDRSVYLGNPYTDNIQIDAEEDGLPSIGANLDDTTEIDDEEAVTFITPMMPGLPAKVSVEVSVDGHLDAWIDFNADGDWDDFGEQIFAAEPVSLGTNDLKFRVPPYPHAVVTNAGTYARFRFSTYGGLRYCGPARNGEVEDYHVHLEEPQRPGDLGDAPDSSNNFNVTMHAYPSHGPLPVLVPGHFPTVYETGSPPYGPKHWNPRAVAYLGTNVSREMEADFGFDEDPLNNLIPLRDMADLDKADDGVRVPLVLPPCRPARFEYVVTVVRPVEALYVNVWFDWNRDGDWDDVFHCDRPNEVSYDRGIAREWAVRNQALTCLRPGVFRFHTPRFLTWYPWNATDLVTAPIWMRITLAESPVCLPIICETGACDAVSHSILGWGGSGPADGYWIGETEDYYFRPILRRIEHADLDSDKIVDLRDLQLLAEQWLSEAP